MEEYAFKAVYGSTVIKGQTFTGVADALVERGFDMARAKSGGDGILTVPHKLPRRRSAVLTYEMQRPEPEPPKPPTPAEVRAAEYAASLLSNAPQAGIRTRPCGAVHSEGVVCLIPVFFEALHCGCGDMVYPHEQPHEACDPDGVRYRWEEVLMIQDLPYDSYSNGEQVSA